MNCINLQQHFGRRFRIAFDPSYDPRHRPQGTLDPWYMLIPCRRGVVYPWGGQKLVAEVEGRAVTANRLRELNCTTVFQDGDGFLAVTFDVNDFDDVAAILQPRRRRQVSDAERDRLRSLSARHGFHSQTHQSERSRRPVTPAAGST